MLKMKYLSFSASVWTCVIILAGGQRWPPLCFYKVKTNLVFTYCRLFLGQKCVISEQVVF